MTKRSLDIAQASSSNRMRLTVDRWAGSFEGQQRAKLEMAIGPELEALDKSLEKAQKTARGVLDELEADKQWRGTHDRDVGSAERSTVEALEIVKKLQDRSKGHAVRVHRAAGGRHQPCAHRSGPQELLEDARIGRRRPRYQRPRRLAAFGPGARAGCRASRPVRAGAARVPTRRVGREGQEDVPGVR